MRRWILPVVVAALASTTLSGPALAAEPEGPVLVTGTIEGADGAPAPGVPVAIRVWPDSETLGALPVGAGVPTEIVGTAVTDAEGEYRLSIDPAASPASFADASGVVSFDVVAGEGADSASYSLTRPASDLGAAQRTARTSAPKASTVDLTLPVAAASAARSGVAAAPAVGCSLQKLGTYGARWVTVGETYTHPGSTATFTYTSGASSTLGIGVSAGGGAFTAGGTSSVSSSATLGFPTTPVNSARQWRTQYQYDKFTDLCGHIYARPTSFLGGTGIVYAVTISATKCVPMLAGSTHTQATDNATTLATGVDTSGAIGIDLSARTGYTSKAKVKYTFASPGKLCGTIGKPGSNPGRLAAKS